MLVTCKITTGHPNFTIEETFNIFHVFCRSDESNCTEIQSGAEWPKQDLLNECYFGGVNGKFAKKNPAFVTDSDITESNGFECGEFNCIPIEYFCNNGQNELKDFPAQTLCPGFHIRNSN